MPLVLGGWGTHLLLKLAIQEQCYLFAPLGDAMVFVPAGLFVML
jgi:hypothetical protein